MLDGLREMLTVGINNSNCGLYDGIKDGPDGFKVGIKDGPDGFKVGNTDGLYEGFIDGSCDGE